MSNSLFPSVHGLGWPVKTVAAFNTIVQEAPSGREVRSALRQYPIYKWSFVYNYLWDGRYGVADLATIRGFILKRQGMFDSFLYNDPFDNAVLAQPLGTGDGSTAIFNLSRTFGGFNEPIDWIQAIANVKVGGVPKSAGTDYNIVNGPAQIVFVAGHEPGNTLAIIGDITYYWRVRFDSDEIGIDHIYSQIAEAKQIDLIRVKT